MVRYYAIMKTHYLQKLVFNTFMNCQIIFKRLAVNTFLKNTMLCSSRKAIT